MSDYPDHLNPFKERKKLGKTLTRSFREFKGFIRQSFRKKKSKNEKDDENWDVEIRRTTTDATPYNTLRNNIMSLPASATYSTYTITSPALPRSRFKERLSRSSLSNTFYDERCNPFAEDEGLNPFDEPPVPYRRRKSKKRAPLPPSCSNPDVNMGYKLRGSSKWSLTSSETDYTLDDKSECSADMTYSQSLRECLDNFNKEMDTLNKESLEIGGSSNEIIDDYKQEETECIQKSQSINSVDVEINREINNNEVLNTDETIPVNSSIKLQRKIILGEYYHDSDEESKSDEEEKNEVIQQKIEDEKTSIEETEVEIVTEKQEENLEKTEITDATKEANLNENVIAVNNENLNTEVIPKDNQNENVVAVEHENLNIEVIPKVIKIDEKKQNGFEVVLNDKEILEESKQEFHPDKIFMQYIDEEISCKDELPLNEDDSEQPSPTPKQRTYKLDKVILLGENSIPK
ncbi:hypothetical protein HHI36_023170 [Cryptolaemus montrouzieri]|uniref:Uncharacterized protein n=1 Tax=Cryptolaemus montrouzieri TaxID=559131 RepID=A0ABD2PH69_9CUCU